MGTWVRWIIQLITLGGLSACMQYDFRVVVPQSTKEVKKTVAAAKPTPVDILFVVDNSGSMADEQENLARNFDKFINELAGGKGNDYRIGIVTTDLDSTDGQRRPLERAGLVDAAYAMSSPFRLVSFNSNACSFVDIGHGCFRGDDPAKRTIVSTLSAAEQIETFKANVRVGSCGWGIEKGLEAMERALSNTSSGLCNEGFLRAEANLVVVIVSDEEDSSNPASIQHYVDFLSTLKGGARKVRVAMVVGSVDGASRNCSPATASCGGTCSSRPPDGSRTACDPRMSNCPSGEYCDESGRCQNQDLHDWANCHWCSFYNTADCCSAIGGSRYVDFALAVERAVHADDASVDITQCRGGSDARLACLIDSICQNEFAETLRRIARDLIVTDTYSLEPPAKYPPGVVVEVNKVRLKICASATDTDCDYTVAADGKSLVIKRNAPGENDEVEIYFVIEESDAG